MQGSLALRRGTLFVGVHHKTARVQRFDLGGRALGPAFSFRDARAGRSAVAGLAVDEDHALWIADTPADRVRVFSVFGREVGGLGGPQEGADGEGCPVLPGLVTRPVDVEVQGHRDQGWVAIACSGERRHAVQIFDPDLTWRSSCASLGRSQQPFGGVCRLASWQERLFVAESRARRVQVFRAGEFLFAFQITGRAGVPFEPSALAALPDGRMVVGCRAPESALFLLDASARVLRALAGAGEEEGRVLEPSDAVVDLGIDDRHARLFVIDRDGLRVQVFTLEGCCLGSIQVDGIEGGQVALEKKGGR